MLKINFCRRYFPWAFGISMSAYFMTFALPAILLFVGYGQESLKPGVKSLIVLFPVLGIFAFAGLKIYDNYLGSKLRQRGWNEMSYFRGLELSILTMLVLFCLPQLMIVFVYIILH